MKKIICFFSICLVILISSCKMKLNKCSNEHISLENDQVITYYLDEDPNDILKQIKIKVKSGGKETLIALNDQLIKVENFLFDKVGDFTSIITYNNQKLDLKYRVAIRKWDKSIDTSWYDESKDIFEIKTASQLAGLAELVNQGTSFVDKTIKLKNDIDLNHHQWKPIGTSGKGVYDDMSKFFNGTFDGNQKTIYNLNITASHESKGEHISSNDSYYHAGLFGYCKNVMIKNLKIENIRILNGMGNNFIRSLQGTGSLAGRIVGNSTITNVKITGKVIIDGEYKVGGLIGSCSGEKINIKNCSVKGDDDSHVLGTDALYKDTNNFGGLVGYIDAATTNIVDCYTYILVSGYTAGGIIGNITAGSLLLENVCVYGDTANTEGSVVGGLIGGRFIDMTIKKCYVLGKIITSTDTNQYADIMISKYGDLDHTITHTELYYNSENYNADDVFNTLNAVGKTKDELMNLISDNLK